MSFIHMFSVDHFVLCATKSTLETYQPPDVSVVYYPVPDCFIHQVDPSGEILCFESGGLPWKDHLFTLEEELALDPIIKFVLYSDQSAKWRVQCVPIHLHSFENR